MNIKVKVNKKQDNFGLMIGTPCRTESSVDKMRWRLICCPLISHLTIFSDHINLPILKKALRIAQTAILVVVLALRKSTLSLNIDCLYCCNMAWNSSIYIHYIYIYKRLHLKI